MAGARAEAAAIEADGDRRATAARDEAVRRLADAAAADAAAMVADAERQADLVRALAGRRILAMADLAAGKIKHLLISTELPDGNR